MYVRTIGYFIIYKQITDASISPIVVIVSPVDRKNCYESVWNIFGFSREMFARKRHTQNSISNLFTSNQILIIITLFRSTVSNQ